jgi:hypothetical protein
VWKRVIFLFFLGEPVARLRIFYVRQSIALTQASGRCDALLADSVLQPSNDNSNAYPARPGPAGVTTLGSFGASLAGQGQQKARHTPHVGPAES